MLTAPQEAIDDVAGGARGSLIVGASTTPGLYLMPALAGAFDELVMIVASGPAWARHARVEVAVLANELLLMREDGAATLVPQLLVD